mgnify:CR=1 FL=1
MVGGAWVEGKKIAFYGGVGKFLILWYPLK